jgi:hypothetical protein
LLNQKGIKYLILNDSLKDHATEIVKNMSAPLSVIANRDYSVGFSFGDVNVISTGQSQRKIFVENGSDHWKEEVIDGVSDFADLLQERGRATREKSHSGI